MYSKRHFVNLVMGMPSQRHVRGVFTSHHDLTHMIVVTPLTLSYDSAYKYQSLVWFSLV